MNAINTSVIDSVSGDLQRTLGEDKKRIATEQLNKKNDANEVVKQQEKQALAANKNSEASVASDTKKEILTPDQLEKVAQQLQDFVGEMNKGLQFLVDKDSGRDVIKVIDKTSGDLIKQYPTEEVLSLVSKLSEAAGSFINERI